MSSIKLRAFAVLGLAGVLMAGCAGGGGQIKRAGGDKHPETPTEQYKPKVKDETEQLALAPHVSGLSDNQRQAIATFAARYREDGPDEAITLRMPQGVADTVTPARMAAQIVQALEANGVNRGHVRMASYDGTTDPAAPLVLSYYRYEAVIPDCSLTWNNIVATAGNKPTANFGCSTTSNFAAMVADPRDLLRPAESDPADPLRRATVMGLYRKGQITSTARDEQANGAVSKVIP